MKKIISIILLISMVVFMTSCDSDLLTDVYYHNYNELIENLDHAEIVQLSDNNDAGAVVVRTFSYTESLSVIEDFCKIEYTVFYLAILTTPRWVYGTCLRIVDTNGEYSDYGVNDGAIGSCTEKADFDAFIAKYTQ